MRLKWKPVFVLDEERDSVLKIIKIIHNKVNDSSSHNSDTGLLTGSSGINLFLHYFFLIDPNSRLKGGRHSLLENSLKSISNSPLPYSFSSGISGIIWSLCHLKEIGAVSVDLNAVIDSEINLLLTQVSKTELERGNYDYMHGGGGAILYLLSRVDETSSKEGLHELLLSLKKSSLRFPTGTAWLDKLNKETDFNLGLAHGLPSIIFFLLKLYDSGIDPILTKKLLKTTIDWMLSKKNNDNSISLFPNAVSSNSSAFSRLGWCYGDLGIAITLLQVSQALNDKYLKQLAIEIALHSSKRKDLHENLVVDACLCHGTSGIGHIFNRLYNYTELEDFKEAAKYWHLQTLHIFNSSVGLKTFYRNAESEKKEWVEKFGLLEGYSGIGLALIASISEIEPKWDRCLLLS